MGVEGAVGAGPIPVIRRLRSKFMLPDVQF